MHARRSVITITTCVIFSLVSGCGVRLETAAPTELVPNNNELARQALVNDFELVLQNVPAPAEVESTDVAEVLDVISRQATARSAALGGVYVSGLPSSTEPPTSADDPISASPSTGTAAGTVESTVAKLLESSARARTSLELPDDPELARVIASSAIGQVLEAHDLAKAAEASADWPDALLPTQWTNEAPVLSDDAFHSLIVSEDFAGYAYEVAAAMGEPDKRNPLLSVAQRHRDRAELLAQMAALSETPNDPRRAAYELPLDLTADKHVATAKELRGVLRSIEEGLASQYLQLVTQVSAHDRALIFDAALQSARDARARGVTFDEAFPLIADGDQIAAVIPPVEN